MLGGIRFRSYQLFGVTTLALPHQRKAHYDVIVVRVDAIGDFILWRDSLDAYRKMLEGKRSLLICADLVRPLAEQEGVFSDIWSFNRKKFEFDFSYFRKQLRYLRQLSADSVIYPNWERHRMGDLMVHAIQAPVKIGMAGKEKRYIESRYYDRQYTTRVPNPETTSELLAIEWFTRKVVSADYRYGARPLIPAEPQQIDGRYAVFALSASDSRRVWSAEHFAEVIDTIPDSYRIVLAGAGKEDIGRAEVIQNRARNKNRIVNLINRTSLTELVSVIAHSQFVIGNDSAAVHIAAATRVPSVCILPGAHYNRFVPYPQNTLIPEAFLPRPVYHKMDCFGCAYHCIYPVKERYECLRQVSVEDVVNKMKELCTSQSL